jgi:chemotaxis protein CheX
MISSELLVLLNTTEEQLTEHLSSVVREIFSIMVGADIVYVQTTATEVIFNDSVTAMVGFAGSYNGMICIQTPLKLANAFTTQMLGKDFIESEDEVHDALGEIANMIGGSFKHFFVADGHEVKLSTPSVISGEHNIKTRGNLTNMLTLMFVYAAEKFTVGVYLETLAKTGR